MPTESFNPTTDARFRAAYKILPSHRPRFVRYSMSTGYNKLQSVAIEKGDIVPKTIDDTLVITVNKTLHQTQCTWQVTSGPPGSRVSTTRVVSPQRLYDLRKSAIQAGLDALRAVEKIVVRERRVREVIIRTNSSTLADILGRNTQMRRHLATDRGRELTMLYDSLHKFIKDIENYGRRSVKFWYSA